jgi:hypothetical protein
MKDSGLLLTKTEYDNLYKYFDKNYDDQVSFHEFISFFRCIYFIISYSIYSYHFFH